jgi:formylglycine-generating enzyme required for sulfatase activity
MATDRGTLEIKALDDDVKVEVSQGGRNVAIVDTQTKQTVRLRTGRYEAQIVAGKEGLTLSTNEFTLRRGETVIAEVRPPAPRPPLGPTAVGSRAEPSKDQRECAKRLGVPVEATNTLGMKFMLIPPGEFQMGIPREQIEEVCRSLGGYGSMARTKADIASESPRHRVRITRAFYLGRTEVTRNMFRRVMGKDPSLSRTSVGDAPVENVSWDEACEFCRKMSQLPGESNPQARYRLPTEAEWEYACRAGSQTRFFWGDDPNGWEQYAWMYSNAAGTPQRVATRRPNPWGLHDMSGNVSEWCADWFGEKYYAESPLEDPRGPASGIWHVMRGSDCKSGIDQQLRCAARAALDWGDRHDATGFRVVLELPGGASRR